MGYDTTFTVLSETDNDMEWPHGRGTTTSLMEGDLADRIRRKLDVHERTPVVIHEERVDGGYSEYTQETDFYFELRVGNEKVNLPDHAYNQVAALTEWLERDAD